MLGCFTGAVLLLNTGFEERAYNSYSSFTTFFNRGRKSQPDQAYDFAYLFCGFVIRGPTSAFVQGKVLTQGSPDEL